MEHVNIGRIIHDLKEELAKAPKWISVKERLPEIDQPVFYYAPPVGTHKGFYWGDGTSNVFGGRSGFLTDDVTYWMPVFEPDDKERL